MILASTLCDLSLNDSVCVLMVFIIELSHHLFTVLSLRLLGMIPLHTNSACVYISNR